MTITRVVGTRPTDEVGTNPKDVYGIAKVPLSLNSPIAQILCAMGKKIGAIKYGEYNYRVAKVQSRVYLEAWQRHSLLLLDGEDFDRDTGYPHICFVLACADIVADAWVNGFLIDTRPLAGRSGELIALLNELPGAAPRTPEENMNLFRNLLSSPRETTYTMEHPMNLGELHSMATKIMQDVKITTPTPKTKATERKHGRRPRSRS